MAIARIDNYLAKENRTFEEGRMLYEQYGTNIFILALIRSGTGAYQFKRLIEALTELSTKGLTDSPAKPVSRNIPIQPKKKEIPALETFHTEVRGETNKPEYESLPDSIKRLIAKKNQHYRRALQLFIEIPYLETAEERAQHAITLLRDHRAVQDYWRLIDEFKETGKEITSAEQTLEEEVNDLTLIGLAKESKNLPPNISKTKAKLKDLPDGKKRSKALVKLQLFEKRLELVKIRIKQLSDEQQVDR